MKPVDQTQFIGEGVGGNCVQASVASILELSLEEVPHFLEVLETPNMWELAFSDWLEERGIGYVRLDGFYIWDGYYLACGPSPRGVSHMVVNHNGGLCHDPHPSRAGILDVKYIYVLAPFDPAIRK